MALTIAQILTTDNDEALFELLSEELQRLLPEEVSVDPNGFHEHLKTLPPGLRAMAGIHFFDKSMALDSLARHFGNQNDERDLQETLNGLRELELPEIADRFEKMWQFMVPYLDKLSNDEIQAEDFTDWLVEIGAEDFASPMDDFIWEYCKSVGDLGLLHSWAVYARKHPDRCVVADRLG